MDLQWYQNDQLITWTPQNQDITLYKVEDSIKQGCSRLSETKSLSYITKITDFSYPKIVEAYYSQSGQGPGSESAGLIAVGLANGKIVITSFASPSTVKELAPKHSRQINSLQWNKNKASLLVGFEKARSEYSFSVWDVGSGANVKLTNGLQSDLRFESGLNETSNSVAWVQDSTILVGMNGKHIKLFDLRDPQPKLGSTALTKAVYGLTVDLNHRVGSFADNQVFVWDMRNFDKPFVVLNHSKNLSKIQWCPTRSGLLACLERDSSYITLHDVNHAEQIEMGDGEPVVLERRLTPAYPLDNNSQDNGSTLSEKYKYSSASASPVSTLSGFSWHPTEENLITTVNSLGVLWNSVIFERVTLNWGASSILSWSNGKKLLQYIDNSDEIYDDISIKMKNRALNGYGLKTNLKDNAKLVEDELMLVNVWEWLDFCKILMEKEKGKMSSLLLKYPGVKSILKIDSNSIQSPSIIPQKSEIVINNSFDLHNNKTYKSEERSFVQQLCGWDSFDVISSPSRKAAISLFHLKLRQAIRILNDDNQTIVAMALSGFSEDKNSLWSEMAQLNFGKIGDPYIRAIFSFLTDHDSNFDLILNDSELLIGDRIGFACSFLNDFKLVNFIQEITNDMIKTGDLNGILLTGMTTCVIPLFQKYLDLKGDIQTIALLSIRTMSDILISNNGQLKIWIDTYRELLDSWKLWERRAEFDIIKNKNNQSLIPQPEITVSCNYCGKNISPGGGLVRTTHLFSRFTTTSARIKLSCCPSCRKPLPRCVICLLHMGTILGDKSDKIPGGGCSQEALSWYTWCQKCRHGGHTVHLQTWFENQMECPVLACNCKCGSLDYER